MAGARCRASLNRAEFMREGMSPDAAQAPPSSASNPYAPPEASVEDRFSETDVRRDGDRLVLTLGRGLTSCCATCGRDAGLRLINPRMLWRNPKGCAASLGFVILTVVAIQVGLSGAQVLYAVAGMLLGFTVANVYWRSRRFRLSLSICKDCYRARVRWWIGAGGLLAGAFVAAFYIEFAILLPPLVYAAARRFQPATLRPRRVIRDQVWLTGASDAVLARFPELTDEH